MLALDQPLATSGGGEDSGVPSDGLAPPPPPLAPPPPPPPSSELPKIKINKTPGSPTPVKSDLGGDLINQIKQGVQLKKAEPVEKSKIF